MTSYVLWRFFFVFFFFVFFFISSSCFGFFFISATMLLLLLLSVLFLFTVKRKRLLSWQFNYLGLKEKAEPYQTLPIVMVQIFWTIALLLSVLRDFIVAYSKSSSASAESKRQINFSVEQIVTQG